MWFLACAGMLACVAPPIRGETKPAHEVRRLPGQVYAEREGRKLRADVYLPNTPGVRPAVLMIHGGGWMSGARWHMARHARTLTQAGYAVVSIDYRLAPAHKFPAQLEDCRDAWRWMSDMAAEWQIDTQQMSLYGYSAGAHLACLVGLQIPENDPEWVRPRAIVAGGAPCDFEWIDARSKALAFFLGGSRADQPDVYLAASPVHYVSADDPPVLLYHGEIDTLVPLVSPRRLESQLQRAGIRCELVIAPGRGHLAAFIDPDAPRRAVRFLDDVLQRAAAAAAEDNTGREPQCGR